MTAAVWFRGLLRDEYGVDHRSITWVTRQKQRFSFPAGARVEVTRVQADAKGNLTVSWKLHPAKSGEKAGEIAHPAEVILLDRTNGDVKFKQEPAKKQ